MESRKRTNERMCGLAEQSCARKVPKQTMRIPHNLATTLMNMRCMNEEYPWTSKRTCEPVEHTMCVKTWTGSTHERTNERVNRLNKPVRAKLRTGSTHAVRVNRTIKLYLLRSYSRQHQRWICVYERGVPMKEYTNMWTGRTYYALKAIWKGSTHERNERVNRLDKLFFWSSPVTQS